MTLRRLAPAAAAALAALAALSLAPGELAAQEGAGGAPATTVRAPHRNAFYSNPISIIFGDFTAEFERAFTPYATFGLHASYFAELDEDDESDADFDEAYTTGEAKLRYYPSGAFERWSIGAAVGVTRREGELERANFDDPLVTGSVTGPSFAIELNYNWVVGDERRFMIAAGFGAKRVFADVDRFRYLDPAYPTGRLVVGWKF